MLNAYINHVCLVLDESSSMLNHSSQLIKVADNQIAYLAVRSKELDQETRITVYSFGTGGYGSRGGESVRCLVPEMDVLRVPSIAGLYSPNGRTPLIDATMLALSDLKMTPEKYGEHAFLIYVLTDGIENESKHRPEDLHAAITGLPDHWTVAALVPNQNGKFEAKKQGFPAGNIEVWDATTTQGIAEAGTVIREATERFMQGRAEGRRGSRNLFQVAEVSAQDVKRQLAPVTMGSYYLLPVTQRTGIAAFCTKETGDYHARQFYYELVKRETIQGDKKLAILMKPEPGQKEGRLYEGKQARQLLGLPDHDERVSPSKQKEIDAIFVQSGSHNRVLEPGTRVLSFR